MTSIVLGTVQFGLNYGINNKTGKPSEAQILELLQVAWDSGVRELDTAQDYGNSEEVLGACFKKLPLKFKVHSKFSDSGIPIQEAINVSLKHLAIDKLDYFYFHKFSDYLTYRVLKPQGEELHSCAGLAVSVYDEEELKMTLGDSFVKAVQVPMNVLDCSEEKLSLIKEAKNKGKKIYVRSAFLQGLLLMPFDSIPEKLKSLQGPLREFENICHKFKLSKRDISLGFLNHYPEIDGLLIGVDNKEQLRENIESLKTKLSDEVVKEIKAIKVESRLMLLPKNWN